MKKSSMQDETCKCGTPDAINWLGRGQLCSKHFDDAYHEMNKDDEEFEVKQRRIKEKYESKKRQKQGKSL